MPLPELEYQLARASIALLITSFLLYTLFCIVSRKPLTLAYLSRALPFAGLPTIATFLYGAYEPSFLVAACAIAPDCLSWPVRLVLTLSGLFALILFLQGVGVVRWQPEVPTRSAPSPYILP